MLPENPCAVAKKLAKKIKEESRKKATVLIIDTDATYKKKKKYFTGLPTAISPIKSNMGVFGYILGQIYQNAGSTPLGCSKELNIEKALELANTAESYQKSLETNLATIHSVKKVINKEINDLSEQNSNTHDFCEISVNELNSIVHTPAIILRPKKY